MKPIPKFEKMQRVSARSSWMLIQQPMPIRHTSEEAPLFIKKDVVVEYVSKRGGVH